MRLDVDGDEWREVGNSVEGIRNSRAVFYRG